jgi:hypothetical protein
MSKVSKIVVTTLNGLLSPLKTFYYTLFQIPKSPYLKTPIKPFFRSLIFKKH